MVNVEAVSTSVPVAMVVVVLAELFAPWLVSTDVGWEPDSSKDIRCDRNGGVHGLGRDGEKRRAKRTRRTLSTKSL